MCRDRHNNPRFDVASQKIRATTSAPAWVCSGKYKASFSVAVFGVHPRSGPRSYLPLFASMGAVLYSSLYSILTAPPSPFAFVEEIVFRSVVILAYSSEFLSCRHEVATTCLSITFSACHERTTPLLFPHISADTGPGKHPRRHPSTTALVHCLLLRYGVLP